MKNGCGHSPKELKKMLEALNQLYGMQVV